VEHFMTDKLPKRWIDDVHAVAAEVEAMLLALPPPKLPKPDVVAGVGIGDVVSKRLLD